MNKNLRRASRDKARLHRKFKKYPNQENWEKYRKQRNKTTTIRKMAIRDYFQNKCKGGQSNPDFWKTVKPFLTNKGSVSSNNVMIQTDDSIETRPEEVANLMNNFYTNIASQIGGTVNITQENETNSEFVKVCANLYQKPSEYR